MEINEIKAKHESINKRFPEIYAMFETKDEAGAALHELSNTLKNFKEGMVIPYKDVYAVRFRFKTKEEQNGNN
jgi:hypothetical protein